METQLEQLDYVIETLSNSTNEKHRLERESCLKKLQVTRDIAFMTPWDEPSPELQDGCARYYFKTKAEMLKSIQWFSDYDFELRLTKSGFEIDVRGIACE
jgi:hypothetical protein